MQVFLQGKQGIFDIKNHRFILDPKFDKIDGCDNNTQRISLNGKYGVINENAQLIVPIKFDYISPCFSNNLGFASDKNKVGYINKKGEFVIPAKFETVTPFKYGFAQVKLDKNKKFGLINTKGDLVLPFDFDSIFYIEPLATSDSKLGKIKEVNKDVSTDKGQKFFVVEKNVNLELWIIIENGLLSLKTI
ncbi:WG repeat-containing protein [Campylobacter sp. S4:11]|uniref:WG repeat-containing protein n=1 Tax=Campylobacter sp. S4:11 TaxID=2735745 RepID=UPI00301E55EA|nr:WG repeat-containing protein [Campylobacter sp. S4:11]